ncbi:uncharacterized protein FRV6_16978 [Fusarium oxysporum]|uniref:Uncharacterized protein n=1 Tax=Fusarium oxysporum TaxID=5507 RepID=A0A2H3U7J9_FUSOX|nr:uncharacterized protein FRV6_16978 [Fusarium oxysporum]
MKTRSGLELALPYNDEELAPPYNNESQIFLRVPSL